MTADRKPVYLLAGGPSSVKPGGPDPLIQGALEQAGLVSPSVAYIGAASKDNEGFLEMIAARIRRAGAGKVRLAPLCGRRADSEKAIDVIESCDIVFISGGDVEAGMKVLTRRRMIEFLQGQYTQGKPFFGASAGSIMLAKSWVRWRDPDDDSTAELFPCLGIAPVYCDTHGEDTGWEELRVLMRWVPPGSVGYGIASGTALIADPDGSLRCSGGNVHRFTRTNGAVREIEPLRD